MAEKRIKILLVIRQLTLGGSEKHVFDLATGLDKDEFEVEVLCFTPGGEIAERLDGAGIRVHLVRKFFALDPAFPFRLAAMMRSGGYDVVQTFLFSANVWGGLAARLAGSRRKIATSRETHFVGSRFKIIIFRAVVPSIDVLLCNSEAAKRSLVDKAGVPAGNVEVVYNGVDTGKFAPAARNEKWGEQRRGNGLPDAEGSVVVSVANMTHFKNHALLIDAMKNVFAEKPEARLLLVGDGPLRAKLEERAERNGISKNVRFLGQLSDPLEILRLSDAFVLSSHTESLPNAVCEAMAVGLPCVATDVGGVGEVVVDGETGYLVPPEDEEALTDKILFLLNHPDRMAEMGKRGRARVEEIFSMGRLLKRMEEIYRGAPRMSDGG